MSSSMGRAARGIRISGEAKPGAKREEVLRAAARVFARLGYHGASLKDVANELGITPSALYNHVKSKDELLAAGSMSAQENNRRIFDQCRNDAALTGREKLQKFMSLFCEGIRDDFSRCLILTNANDLPPPYGEPMVEVRRELMRWARELIREGIEDRSIAPCDDRLLASVLYGSVYTMAHWWSPKGRVTPTEAMGEIFDMFVVAQQVSTGRR